MEDVERCGLYPRLHERDGSRPSSAAVAEASEPDRGRVERVHVAAASGFAVRAGLWRRTEKPRSLGACVGDRAQGHLRETEENAKQIVELQGPGREQIDDQHAADVRRVHSARNIPLARTAG